MKKYIYTTLGAALVIAGITVMHIASPEKVSTDTVCIDALKLNTGLAKEAYAFYVGEEAIGIMEGSEEVARLYPLKEGYDINEAHPEAREVGTTESNITIYADTTTETATHLIDAPLPFIALFKEGVDHTLLQGMHPVASCPIEDEAPARSAREHRFTAWIKSLPETHQNEIGEAYEAFALPYRSEELESTGKDTLLCTIYRIESAAIQLPKAHKETLRENVNIEYGEETYPTNEAFFTPQGVASDATLYILSFFNESIIQEVGETKKTEVDAVLATQNQELIDTAPTASACENIRLTPTR